METWCFNTRVKGGSTLKRVGARKANGNKQNCHIMRCQFLQLGTILHLLSAIKRVWSIRHCILMTLNVNDYDDNDDVVCIYKWLWKPMSDRGRIWKSWRSRARSDKFGEPVKWSREGFRVTKYISSIEHGFIMGSLRSSNSSLLAAPISSTVESGRAYRSAAPLVWNALPIELRTMLCINDFKKYLKTCLCKEALLACA